MDNSSSDGILKRVPKNGGTVSTLLTGLTTFDGGFPWFVVNGSGIYGAYGGYREENVFVSPLRGGNATTLASITGGAFIGVSGSQVYYSSGFSYINSVPASGGSPMQIAANNVSDKGPKGTAVAPQLRA